MVAYPNTNIPLRAQTRITTRYYIRSATSRETEKPKEATTPAKRAAALAATDRPPRGHLVLRTYDPASGAVLRYRTSKAAEVAHLVQMLAGLGRRMAALPPREEEPPAPEAPAKAAPDEGGSGAQTPVPGVSQVLPQQQQGGPSGGGGGAGKKKKGKGKR